jgi:hypothetical protein
VGWGGGGGGEEWGIYNKIYTVWVSLVSAVVLRPTKLFLRLVLKIFVSVCVYVHMEQRGSHWTDFHEILNPSSFRKYVENI